MEIQKPNTIYKTARYGCCTFSLILDKRHTKKGKETYPVAMRYTVNRKSWYNYVEGEYTEEDFTKICNLNSKSVRSELYPKKVEFDNLFENYRSTIERLVEQMTRLYQVFINKEYPDTWTKAYTQRAHNGATVINVGRRITEIAC